MLAQIRYRTRFLAMGAGNRGESLLKRRSIRLCVQSLVVLTLCIMLWPAQSARAATITVTSTGDSGPNTLRQAIIDANASVGVSDVILFNLGAGVQTIQLTSGPLPTITDPVEINALSGGTCNTWPPQPRVVLDGSLVGADADGFKISANNSRIIGFYIQSFVSDGIEINAANAIVSCNIIGLNSAGNGAGNGQYGVNLNGNNNIIGNNGGILGNVLSGNIQFGVAIENPVNGNTIRGNYIGTDPSGTQDRGNFAGIAIVSGSNTTIGGVTAADRNVISGNEDQGVWFFIAGSGNKVIGNYIGTDAAGTGALPNATEGVKIQDTNDVTVGGVNNGEGNRIAFNTQSGVLVNGSSQNSRILGNQIFSNNQLGIDLSGSFDGDGVTNNDSGDSDTGANARQNFPAVLEATQLNAGTIKVRGSLNSSANSTFRIELFASPTCDANGFGEGATFLGSTSLTTNFSGNGTYDVQLALAVPLGQKITATATGNNGNAPGNTSEFSVCQTLSAAPPTNAPQVQPDLATTAEDTPVTIDVLANDTSPNGNPMTVVSVGTPNVGTAQIVNNKILYTPPANFFGEATFFYSAHNGDTTNARQSTVKVTVTSVNDLPTDIVFTGSMPINERLPIPSNVGQLSLVDVETNLSTFLFSLVDAGQPNDNANFLIFGSNLLLTTPLNFTNRTNITLGIQGRDSQGGILIKNVVIPLPTINHAPTRLSLSSASINENQPAGLVVGTLSTQDPDPNETFTYSLVPGFGDNNNSDFRIEGTTVKTNAVLDFEKASSSIIRVRVTDKGGQFFESAFTIVLNNIPSPPDAPVNTLSFCSGNAITLLSKNSSIASLRVSVTIGNIVISAKTATSCNVTGKMHIVTNGNTVNNLPFTGVVNSRNQFSSATIPDFALSVAGLTLKAAGVQILYTSDQASLHITQPSLAMPKEFGGLSAGISIPVRIDRNGLRFGGSASINLPTISTKSGFELGLSGKLEESNGGYKISADGTITIPNIGKKSTGAVQTCGISAGVTIFADSSGQTVMTIAAGKDYPGITSTTTLMAFTASDSPNITPNGVAGPYAVDAMRLDAIRAGASCSPGLAIGSTGLFLTGLSGEITLTPGAERVDVAVTIEAGEELPGIGPILSIDGNMGFQPKPFQLDLGGAIHMLSIEVAKANAKITTKSFTATMSFQTVGYFGSVSIAAFAKDGSPTFTGSAMIALGIREDAVTTFIPPFDIVLASVSADVGEFTNGNFGFKGNVNILGLVTVGFFIDHKNNTAFGDVSKYKLIDAPTVAAAYAAYRQAIASGAMVDAVIASEYTFLDDGSGGNGGVIIRTPLVKPTIAGNEVGPAAVTDVITQVNLLQHGDVIFVLGAQGPITMTLITPQGEEVTPANYDQSEALGYVISYTSTVGYKEADALEQLGEDSDEVEDNSLPHLLFAPLAADTAVNHVDLKIDGVAVYFDLTFENGTDLLKPIALTPGEHTVQLVTHGTDNVVLETIVNLASDTDYSLLNIGGSSAGFVTLVDNYDEPSTLGKAKVRFYNGASATLNMLVNGAPLFTGVGYNTASDYVLVDAGSTTIEFRNQADDTLASQPVVVELADGGVYTFFSTDYTVDGYDTTILQREDALYAPTYLTYYAVDQAHMNEEWQVKLVGDTNSIPYKVAIMGPSSAAVLGSVMVDAGNLAATQVSWQLTADVQPVTVTVYTNPGEITTSLVVTNTDGTTGTVQIPAFQGTPVGEFKITSPGELGGQMVTKQVDLSGLESGTYHLWIRADDGINAPVNAYAASVLAKSEASIESVYGANPVWVAKADYNPLAQLAEATPIVIDRGSDFPTTWTANITTAFEPVTNALDVQWSVNTHPDVDSYRLLFGNTPMSPTQVLEVGGAIAEFNEAGEPTGLSVGAVTLQDIMPGVPYYISIEAVDSESGKSVRSQEVEFTAVAGGFTLTSPQHTINMDAGDTTTIPVTLNADETLFFPNVWLSTNLGGTAPGITARFVEAPNGDTNLNLAAPTKDLQISVDATVADGRYPLVITGYNGDAKQALTLEIVVGEPVAAETGAYMPFLRK